MATDTEVLRRIGETFAYPGQKAIVVEAADEIDRLRAALAEACNIALGTDLTREAAERIKELRDHEQ